MNKLNMLVLMKQSDTYENFRTTSMKNECVFHDVYYYVWSRDVDQLFTVNKLQFAQFL